MTVQLFTPEYAALQAQFHKDRPDYGISGSHYSEQILKMSQLLQTRSILDYGCGKCTLQKALPFPIQNFDPFMPEHMKRPLPADIVVCTDVMEHVEEPFVEQVIYDIARLANKAVFFQIATSPAKKTLPDGRNAHITLHDLNWWLAKLMNHLNIKSIMELGGGFVAVCSPKWNEGTVSPIAEAIC